MFVMPDSLQATAVSSQDSVQFLVVMVTSPLFVYHSISSNFVCLSINGTSQPDNIKISLLSTPHVPKLVAQ
jgi:hypothetical protein